MPLPSACVRLRLSVFVLLIAHDVEEGLLLPSEGSVWQILGRRRRPHCERELVVAAGDAAPLFLAISQRPLKLP